MKKTLCAKYLLLFMAHNASAAEAATLAETFNAALSRAQTVKIQSDVLKQVEEHYQQAHAGLMPTVTGVASYALQQPTAKSNANNPSSQPFAKITASESLFRGFRDLATLRQDTGLINASKLDRDAAVVQLYKDVAQAFYTVVILETDFKNLQTEILAYGKRIEELEKFQRKGRSRPSEVLTAKSGQASLLAQSDQVQGQLAAAREVLGILTGYPLNTVFDEPKNPPAPLGTLAEGLQNIDSRPEIIAAQARIQAGDEAVEIARGEQRPSVDLSGNIYLYRTGTNKDSYWDAQLGVSIPIYSGGLVESHVNEAVAKNQQTKDGLIQARQAAEQEIRTLYDQINFDLKQIKDLAIAADLAAKSYQEQSKDYRFGLETNLDVLAALQAAQESARTLDRAQNTLKLDREKYAAALAQRPLNFKPSPTVELKEVQK